MEQFHRIAAISERAAHSRRVRGDVHRARAARPTRALHYQGAQRRYFTLCVCFHAGTGGFIGKY